MKFELRAATMGALLVVAAVAVPSQALAQNPPPGAILDMVTAHPTAFTASTYVQFTTSFVADTTGTEFVSFAFRESPAFWSFDDPCVYSGATCTTNLLADGNFETDTPANVGTNFPAGWGRWIQPVDTSFIGVVEGNGNSGSCPASGPHTGSYFWCDGSVQGYDALYQAVSVILGQTYNISFWLTDNSGGGPVATDAGSQVDMLVYAGDQIPVGTQPIGTPEPATYGFVGLGLAGLGLVRARRNRKA